MSLDSSPDLDEIGKCLGNGKNKLNELCIFIYLLIQTERAMPREIMSC